MSVGRDRIRASAHNLRHDMFMRWQAVDGAGRNALLANSADPEYERYRHVRGRLHCERPVQVARCATKRGFVSGDNKLETFIWLGILDQNIS
jgi:hypothetical protein